jgi:hypothetical protein
MVESAGINPDTTLLFQIRQAKKFRIRICNIYRISWGSLIRIFGEEIYGR